MKFGHWNYLHNELFSFMPKKKKKFQKFDINSYSSEDDIDKGK